MNKKYEFTGEEKSFGEFTLKRIRAIRDFGVAKKGDLGGWIEDESNLSHDGDAWVFGEAQVYEQARVLGGSRIYGQAQVYGMARVYGMACVSGYSRIHGKAEICGDSWVYGEAQVYGDAEVCENARVYGYAEVFGEARVFGSARVCWNARVFGEAQAYGQACIHGEAQVYGQARVDSANVCGYADVFEMWHILTFGNTEIINRTLTAFKTKDAFEINIGNFTGDLESSVEWVEKTHGGNKFLKEYRMIAEIIKYRFLKDEKGEEKRMKSYELTEDEYKLIKELRKKEEAKANLEELKESYVSHLSNLLDSAKEIEKLLSVNEDLRYGFYHCTHRNIYENLLDVLKFGD